MEPFAKSTQMTFSPTKDSNPTTQKAHEEPKISTALKTFEVENLTSNYEPLSVVSYTPNTSSTSSANTRNVKSTSVSNAWLSAITQLSKQEHLRVKEEEFYSEIDRIISTFETAVNTVKVNREQQLNPIKIRKSINEKIEVRQQQFDLEITETFDVFSTAFIQKNRGLQRAHFGPFT